jgi:hypothetical protein
MRLRRIVAACALSACNFDSGGQATGTSLADPSDTSTSSDPAGTSGTPDPDTAAETSASPSTSTATDATTGGETSTTDIDTSGAGTTSSGGEPPVETCNGVDDDADGAIDEYSPRNSSCGSCEYTLTGTGVVLSYCMDAVSWPVALANCEVLGASLATIHSRAENEELFAVTGDDEAWIGATDDGNEGAWGWHDGSPFDFTAWGPTQPNNFGDEDCAHTQTIGATWNDDECTNTRAYVCRAPA